MGRPALHFHLSHLHNVVPECVEKLLLVVSIGCMRTHPEGPVRAGQEWKQRQRCWASMCVLMKETPFHRLKVNFRFGGNLRVELLLLPVRKLNISFTSVTS